MRTSLVNLTGKMTSPPAQPKSTARIITGLDWPDKSAGAIEWGDTN